jgi:hypothetical protein
MYSIMFNYTVGINRCLCRKFFVKTVINKIFTVVFLLYFKRRVLLSTSVAKDEDRNQVFRQINIESMYSRF